MADAAQDNVEFTSWEGKILLPLYVYGIEYS